MRYGVGDPDGEGECRHYYYGQQHQGSSLAISISAPSGTSACFIFATGSRPHFGYLLQYLLARRNLRHHYVVRPGLYELLPDELVVGAGGYEYVLAQLPLAVITAKRFLASLSSTMAMAFAPAIPASLRIDAFVASPTTTLSPWRRSRSAFWRSVSTIMSPTELSASRSAILLPTTPYPADYNVAFHLVRHPSTNDMILSQHINIWKMGYLRGNMASVSSSEAAPAAGSGMGLCC